MQARVLSALLHGHTNASLQTSTLLFVKSHRSLGDMSSGVLRMQTVYSAHLQQVAQVFGVTPRLGTPSDVRFFEGTAKTRLLLTDIEPMGIVTLLSNHHYKQSWPSAATEEALITCAMHRLHMEIISSSDVHFEKNEGGSSAQH